VAQSARFAQEAALRFAHIPQVISPLQAPRFLPLSMPHANYGGVVFTSETGVAGAVQAAIAPQTAYCVGARTAKAARLAGFEAISADGDWRDLAQLIIAARPAAPLLFLCAKEAPRHLQNTLAKAGISLVRADIYTQDPQPLNADARALLMGDQPVLVALFSPRSAQLFAAAAFGLPAPLWIAALSDNVSAAFSLPYQRHITANRPNSAAMLDAIGQLIEKSS
jgi:uroporphyrinogen-III synthase